MILTQNNYHSDEARRLYLSASAIKQAKQCEFSFCNPKQDDFKTAFVAGHLFELLATQDIDGLNRLYAEHPEMISSQGKTKGQLKVEYRDVSICAERVRNQPFLCDLIDRAEKQTILTGTILGEPVRMMSDLIVDDWIIDLKTAKDFKKVWSDEVNTYVEWWQSWNYPIQMWIYREIARQNGLKINHTGLIGVSKANYDMQAIEISEDLLKQAGADTLYVIGRIKDIRIGAEPIRCECCPTCIELKQIKEFEIIC